MPVFEQRLKGLTKLVDLTCLLAAERDLDRILNLVALHVCEALECDRSSLFLYDPLNRELYTRVATELEIAEIRHSIDLGIAGWVASQREIANVAQPALDPRWNPNFDLETGFQTENILAAPLISKHDSRLMGVLEVLNKRGESSSFDGFDEQLLQAFATHAAVALEQSQLLDDLRHSQLLEASLALARKIQSSFIPQRLPERAGYDIAAWWQPAEEVAGDYYDCLTLSDGRLALAIADVSGHGVGPSLIMAGVRAMLHVLVRTCIEPGQILNLLSETIAPDLNDGLFITFFLGVLDAKSHSLTFANAGHYPALHFHAQTGLFQTLPSSGLPLGVRPETLYSPGNSVPLQPGDIVVLATDGFIEQHNSQVAMFGVQRLQEVVAMNRELPAAALVERVRSALREFLTGPHFNDDVTLLILKRE